MPGQGNYAAANTGLDTLARQRADLGLPATSIAWGPWAVETGGMAAVGDLRRVRREGFVPISVGLGVALLDAAVAGPDPVVVACPLDLDTVRDQAVLPPLLRGLARRGDRPRAESPVDSPTALADRLAELPASERRTHLLDLVRRYVADRLGRPPAAVPTDTAFPALGFDSLGSVELRNRLEAGTGLRLPATLLFDHPTTEALADGLLARFTGAATAEHGDPVADVVLADDVQPAADVVRHAPDPGHVLLTGATGFLGAYLLAELLRATSAVVHCLVRADDEAQASQRISANLAWYELDVDLDRIRAVPGDLAAPRFGRTEAEFDDLARTVDLVLHAGAQVNWLQPYAALRSANVDGTVEVLRLAARYRTVPVHHISTTGVFADPVTPGVALRPEDPTGPPERLRTGYTRSKWVAEQVVGLADRRGLPVVVHRVDLVSDDRRTGACQTRDFIWLSVKGMVQARAVPADLAGTFQMVPVDHVSAAVVALTRHEDVAGRTFHHVGHGSVGFTDLVAHLRSYGRELAELDRGAWRERITADPGNALLPLLDTFDAASTPATAPYLPIDGSATEAATGLERPAMTADLIRSYHDFYTRKGYFSQ